MQSLFAIYFENQKFYIYPQINQLLLIKDINIFYYFQNDLFLYFKIILIIFYVLRPSMTNLLILIILIMNLAIIFLI